MSNRDFFDQDLVKPRADLNQIHLGPGDAPAPQAAPEGGRGVSDIDLPLLARHRQTVDQQSAQAAEELERLRRMQETLERQKRELDETRRKHNDYAHGRQELLDHLNQSLVYIERHEIRAAQISELLQNTRRRCREMLDEINNINEEEWTEDQVKEELGRALARVENARVEYNKLTARLDAVLGGEAGGTEAGPKPTIMLEESMRAEERGFGYWLKVGIAVTLPIILTLVILTVIIMALRSSGVM